LPEKPNNIGKLKYIKEDDKCKPNLKKLRVENCLNKNIEQNHKRSGSRDLVNNFSLSLEVL